MKTISFIALLSMVVLNAFAMDYSAMSMAQMQALRGNVANEDRAAFHTEMQSRIQVMTQEERQAFQVNMKQKRVENEDGINFPMQKHIQMQQQLQTPLKTRLPNAPVH